MGQTKTFFIFLGHPSLHRWIFVWKYFKNFLVLLWWILNNHMFYWIIHFFYQFRLFSLMNSLQLEKVCFLITLVEIAVKSNKPVDSYKADCDERVDNMRKVNNTVKLLLRNKLLFSKNKEYEEKGIRHKSLLTLHNRSSGPLAELSHWLRESLEFCKPCLH